MFLRRVEHAAVMGLGFLAGVVLAMCIAPGDVFLWVVMGVVLGLFSRAFLAERFAGEIFWPFAAHSRTKKHQRRSGPKAQAH